MLFSCLLAGSDNARVTSGTLAVARARGFCLGGTLDPHWRSVSPLVCRHQSLSRGARCELSAGLTDASQHTHGESFRDRGEKTCFLSGWNKDGNEPSRPAALFALLSGGGYVTCCCSVLGFVCVRDSLYAGRKKKEKKRNPEQHVMLIMFPRSCSGSASGLCHGADSELTFARSFLELGEK